MVIKTGSNSNVDENLNLRLNFINRMCKDIKLQYSKGNYPILIVSGAVALGMKEYGFKEKPREVKDLQMCAGYGQGVLFNAYQAILRDYELKGNQILPTYQELRDNEQNLYIKNGLGHCLRNNSIPVINYNDATDPSEVRQDNDRLALGVAIDSKAKYLILITDVDGFQDSNNNLVKEIKYPLQCLHLCKAHNCLEQLSTGGMKSKLESAAKAQKHGIITYIGSYNHSLEKILECNPGTIIPAH